MPDSCYHTYLIQRTGSIFEKKKLLKKFIYTKSKLEVADERIQQISTKVNKPNAVF